MADYLLRDQAPLSEEQWERLDQTVKGVAERSLVGRRVIPLFGPFGPGVQAIPKDVFCGMEQGKVDLLGEEEGGPVHCATREYLPLPVIYKDFRIHWRDLETSSQMGLALDVSPAAAAAAFCASAEDSMIFNGVEANGVAFQGLKGAEGRNRIAMSDWSQPGSSFQDVVNATQALIQADFFGPFALVVSPRLYAGMNRLHGNSGRLEIEQVQRIATAGVYQTPVLADDVAIVLSVGAENMDLAVGQDLVTAFLETLRMNHYFRVFEILALRIKRPGAICAIEKGGAG
ncbi:MAG: bacteriocin family protein [Armatimonadetes bacterium]|nr:bacteriocin family protein [Armatimonadota bacterium]